MNLDEILAYCCIGIAVIIFGTNFIPVKKIATGDGLFFQEPLYLFTTVVNRILMW